MPRKRKKLIMAGRKTVIKQVNRIDRLCFSEDGIYCGDGQYRFWREYDDSGYGWDGHFDIISKEQLIERIKAAELIGTPVFQKYEPIANEDGFKYERKLAEDFITR